MFVMVEEKVRGVLTTATLGIGLLAVRFGLAQFSPVAEAVLEKEDSLERLRALTL